MAQKTLRSSSFIFILRLLQALFVLVVLGTTGTTASNWVNIWGCTVPARLAWNVACASLTLILLLYLIPTTGPLSKTPFWNRWVQLTLDFIFFIFWIAAAATSPETCTDLCNACGAGYWHAGSTYCNCVYIYAKRQDPAEIFRRASTVTSRPITTSEESSTGNVLSKVSEVAIRRGFDGALVFLFFVTLVYGLLNASNKPSATTASAAEMEEQKENVTKTGETVTETAVPGP